MEPWEEWDQQHVWHPYSSVIDAPRPFPVTSASGVRIRLSSGEELIDGMASWWSAVHGYNHPRLNAALHEQIDNMAHVMFGGLTHEPAARLAKTLCEITPPGLERVFLCDSGSVSVEVAIKMALQFQLARGNTERHRLLTVRGGYHGDTLGAMSVCDPVTGMHNLFSSTLSSQLFAERPEVTFGEPWDDDDLGSLTRLAEQHQGEIAAIILEPIVQGAGGMRFYHPEYLLGVRELCDRFGFLLIADEIATGFGRSGRLFASEYASVTPDILCLGKALTGGYMTLAATLCTDTVAQTICAGTPGVFMHGPTFMANPLACACANASIALLFENDWHTAVTRIEQGLKSGLAPCHDLPQVDDVRALGAIGVVELRQEVDMHRVPGEFVKRGVWVRPFGRLVYVMPPYIISDDELATLTTAICEVITELPG